ncbi:MAG TPA: rhomboid family intramembrane serine protease [Ignavibacteria bacterium]|nr:rhomboid family intramembrane serine protease [Ignavibacteria bacterium]HQY51295.1 rhomboid family intramembrane serine protease [Ignavibacteria bacterium]
MQDYQENIVSSGQSESDLEKPKILSSFFFSGVFVLLLWIIQFLQWSLAKEFATFGVLPRTLTGLKGILTAPLIHADFSHLISNSFSLFLLLFGILYFYRSSAVKVFIIIYLVDGIMVWLFARMSYHIGASGLVYGFAAFLFFSGLFRKDRSSMALSLLVVFLYGGMVWGVLPVKPEISFESHLFGALTGIVCAFIFRKNDPPEKYEWEEEDYEEDDDYDDGKEPEDVEIDEDAEEDDFRRLS